MAKIDIKIVKNWQNKYKISAAEIFWLFEQYLRISKEQILSDSLDIPFLRFQSIKKKLKKYQKGVPLEYLVNKAAFLDESFIVKKGILIPRPETEELVLIAKKKIAQLKAAFKKRISILDIGTGSGVIAIMLKKYYPKISISAVDISKKNIKCAQKNAKKILKDSNKITWFKSSLEKIKNQEQYCAIISNPPYIANSDIKINKNVKKYEPHQALYSGATGLEMFESIKFFANQYLKKKGFILLEFGEGQAEAVKEIYKDYHSFEIIEDMNQKKRFFFSIR